MNLDDLQQQVQVFMVERRGLAMALGVATGALMLLIFAAWPVWNQVQEVRSDIKKASKQLDTVSRQAQVLQKLDIEDSDQYERVAIALPQNKQPLANLLRISQVASTSGVQFLDYNLNPGVVSTDEAQLEKASDIGEFEFDVTLRGTYEQMKTAFALIEQSLPLFSINTFSLATTQSDDVDTANLDVEQRIITVELLLTSYYSYLDSQMMKASEIKMLTASQQDIVDQLGQYSMPTNNFGVNPQEFNNTQLFMQRVN